MEELETPISCCCGGTPARLGAHVPTLPVSCLGAAIVHGRRSPSRSTGSDGQQMQMRIGASRATHWKAVPRRASSSRAVRHRSGPIQPQPAPRPRQWVYVQPPRQPSAPDRADVHPRRSRRQRRLSTHVRWGHQSCLDRAERAHCQRRSCRHLPVRSRDIIRRLMIQTPAPRPSRWQRRARCTRACCRRHGRRGGGWSPTQLPRLGGDDGDDGDLPAQFGVEAMLPSARTSQRLTRSSRRSEQQHTVSCRFSQRAPPIATISAECT